MAFTARPSANGRFDLWDSVRKDVIGTIYGRRNTELVLRALRLTYGHGEQLELELVDEAA